MSLEAGRKAMNIYEDLVEMKQLMIMDYNSEVVRHNDTISKKNEKEQANRPEG